MNSVEAPRGYYLDVWELPQGKKEEKQQLLEWKCEMKESVMQLGQYRALQEVGIVQVVL